MLRLLALATASLAAACTFNGLNSSPIEAPVVVPYYPYTDKTLPKVQQDSNAQMNDMLNNISTPATPAAAPATSNPQINQLKLFKQGR